MTTEFLRVIADWLTGDHAASVNTLLPLIDRDAGDAQPPAVTVYDATRHGFVARRVLAKKGDDVTWPLLTVMLLNDLELDGEVMTTYRDGRGSALVLYAHKEVDTELALAAGGYTMRAVLQSIAELNAPANVAARTRHGVCLTHCTSVREIPSGVFSKLAIDIPVTAAIAVSYDVRDLEPRMGGALLAAYAPGDSLAAPATFARASTATYTAEV